MKTETNLASLYRELLDDPARVAGPGELESDEPATDTGWEPLTVICARCGIEGTSETFMLEEGDEWECPACWERCEAVEVATSGHPSLCWNCSKPQGFLDSPCNCGAINPNVDLQGALKQQQYSAHQLQT